MKPIRYDRILCEIKALKATCVLEVGTWNGDRAIQMMEAILSYATAGAYYGFDLFEDITPGKSADEFNVKRPSRLVDVEKRLADAFYGRKASFRLVKGDTNRKLPAFAKDVRKRILDFAWIDGGHSVTTIMSDYENVRGLVRSGGVIFLDDFYTGMSEETTEKFGANKLISRLWGDGVPVELLPDRDPVTSGGFVQIAKVVIP